MAKDNPPQKVKDTPPAKAKKSKAAVSKGSSTFMKQLQKLFDFVFGSDKGENKKD